MDLFEGPDEDKLEEEVSMDSAEGEELAEEDGKFFKAFYEVGGSRD